MDDAAEPDRTACPECGGAGALEGGAECPLCDGSGVTNERQGGG